MPIRIGILLLPWPAMANGSLLGTGAQLLLALCATLLLIGLLVWLIKKTQFIHKPGEEIKIIATHHLGAKEKLMVVQVQDTQYFIGVSGAGIQCIDTLATPLTPAPNRFTELLKANIKEPQ